MGTMNPDYQIPLIWERLDILEAKVAELEKAAQPEVAEDEAEDTD